MNIRLTPLNVISSVLLIAIAWLFIFADENGWRKLGAVSLLMIWLLSVISDIVFRSFLKDLKRIWIVETVFIVLVAVLILIFRTV